MYPLTTLFSYTLRVAKLSIVNFNLRNLRDQREPISVNNFPLISQITRINSLCEFLDPHNP